MTDTQPAGKEIGASQEQSKDTKTGNDSKSSPLIWRSSNFLPIRCESSSGAGEVEGSFFIGETPLPPVIPLRPWLPCAGLSKSFRTINVEQPGANPEMLWASTKIPGLMTT